MLLREDTSLVYHIAEQPVVSDNDLVSIQGDTNFWKVQYSFNKAGTKKLLEFTTHHYGEKLGYVYMGSLRAIYTIEEVVDNGVIEITFGPNTYKYRLLGKEI